MRLRIGSGAIAVIAALGVHGVIAVGLSHMKGPSLNFAAPAPQTKQQPIAAPPSESQAAPLPSVAPTQPRVIAPAHRRHTHASRRTSAKPAPPVQEPASTPTVAIDPAPPSDGERPRTSPVFELPAQTVQ